MQTFLPVSDFRESARILDYRRLGKQRVEAMQLIKILEGQNTTRGWMYHPALSMWIGHTEALKQYCNFMIDEWIARGYKNNMLLYDVRSITYPKWLGDEKFHGSHRAALLFKNYEYYSQFGWKEKPELKYVWPQS